MASLCAGFMRADVPCIHSRCRDIGQIDTEPRLTERRTLMIDLVYILVTIAFFALMLVYVRACERLGRDTTDSTEKTP